MQRLDGSVDVYPDDKRLPALTNCIVRPPVPGGRVTINPGTQVVIVFENGDPRQRVVIAYGQGSPTAAVCQSAIPRRQTQSLSVQWPQWAS